MNLWIINHYAYAPDHCAGTRHWSLARRLIDRGHSVTVVSTSFFHKACAETRLAKGQAFRHELVDGVPFLGGLTDPSATRAAGTGASVTIGPYSPIGVARKYIASR